jgi:hypothetical protein
MMQEKKICLKKQGNIKQMEFQKKMFEKIEFIQLFKFVLCFM